MNETENRADAESPEETPSAETPTPLEALQAEMEQWRDLAQRKAAEVENIRRRAAQEKEQLISFASERLLTHMLPVVDDLHAAVESSRASDDVEALRQGLDMIYRKALKIFEDHGVSVIETNPGEVFNVDKHEALMHTPSAEHPDGHIIQLVQRGYALHDKVLRHAKVVTSAGDKE